MSFQCDICGKGSIKGHNKSHSHILTIRRWKPNLQKVHAQTPQGTKVLRVCTSCIQAGKVVKAA